MKMFLLFTINLLFLVKLQAYDPHKADPLYSMSCNQLCDRMGKKQLIVIPSSKNYDRIMDIVPVISACLDLCTQYRKTVDLQNLKIDVNEADNKKKNAEPLILQWINKRLGNPFNRVLESNNLYRISQDYVCEYKKGKCGTSLSEKCKMPDKEEACAYLSKARFSFEKPSAIYEQSRNCRLKTRSGTVTARCNFKDTKDIVTMSLNSNSTAIVTNGKSYFDW